MNTKNNEAFFWMINDGRLPPPKAAETLGARFISINPEMGEIEVEFEAKEIFNNPAGNIQGGFLTAMLDDTMGPALAATLDKGEFAPTVSLNVQFFHPATVGKIIGYGKVVKKGKKICFLSGKLLQNDRVIATATASALRGKMK
jgi:uncharacterized domain 1